jgi:Family of unknown function (DUF5519)
MTNEPDTLAPPAQLMEAVTAEVGRWPGVTRHRHRFGGIEFRLGRRELGHLHPTRRGQGLADLPFPRRIRDGLVADGRARPHHVLPDSGWLTAPIGTFADVANVLALFRATYGRALETRSRRGAEDASAA